MSRFLILLVCFSFSVSADISLESREAREARSEQSAEASSESNSRFKIVDYYKADGEEIPVYKQCAHLIDKKFNRKRNRNNKKVSRINQRSKRNYDKADRALERSRAKLDIIGDKIDKGNYDNAKDYKIVDKGHDRFDKKNDKGIELSSKAKEVESNFNQTFSGDSKVGASIKECNSKVRKLSQILGDDFNFEVDPQKLFEEIAVRVKRHSKLLASKSSNGILKEKCSNRIAKYRDEYSGGLKEDRANLIKKFELLKSTVMSANSPAEDGKTKIISASIQKQLDEMKLQIQEVDNEIAEQDQETSKLRNSVDEEKGLDVPLYSPLDQIVNNLDFVEGDSYRLDSKLSTGNSIVPNDKYFENICDMLISKKCSARIDKKCLNEVRFSSIEQTLSEQDIELGEGTGVRVSGISFESFKMIGHYEALKDLEVFLVNEKNFDVFEEPEEYATATGSKCQRRTAYAVDFKACQNIAGAHNLHSITALSKDVFGGAANQINQDNVRRRMQTDVANGKSNQDAAFDAQKSILKGQRDIATAAGATYLASSGVVGGMLASYPTAKEFANKCNRGESTEKNAPPYCYLVQNVSLKKMFPNSQVKAEGYGLLGSLIGETIKYGVEAFTLNDLAKQTQGMQNDLKGALEEVATVGFDSCKNNKELCNTEAQAGETTTLGMGNFSIGANGYDSQAFVQPGAESTGDIDTSTGISKTEAAQLGDSLRDGGDSLSDSFNRISAGKLGGSSGGSGGGGGGGGGAAGGGGGSGGGAGPKAQQGSSGSAGSPKIRTSYTKGKSLAFKRGKSTRKKKSSPYSNLFNKSKPSRGVASQINDIAAKESGLFKKISKRYETLKSSNRLK